MDESGCTAIGLNWRASTSVRTGFIVLLLFVSLTTTAMAQAPIQGIATASSFGFNQTASLEAEAYLLGFRWNARDTSPYEWSFEADRVEVAMTTEHYVALQETSNHTTTTVHQHASGVLVERHPLSYLMATSAAPHDPGAAFGLSFELPPEALNPKDSINFDVEIETESPVPVFGDVYDGDDPASDQPFVSYQQPWPNLARSLEDFRGAVKLEGDFILHVYDILFQIQDQSGNTTQYNATYGGWRGAEPGQPEAPPAEWDVRYAELHFTNATFTFYPAGRPLELNLRSAGLDLRASVVLRDVQGQLQDAAGIQRSLEGSLVELDASDLRLDIQPLAASQQAPPDLRLAFNGSIESATVDGRALSLEVGTSTSPETGASPTSAPSPRTPSPPMGWVVAVGLAVAGVAVVGLGAWIVGREYQARVNPEYVTRRGQSALEEGRITRARALAKRVLRHHPHESEAVALGAMLHAQRKQTREMLAFLDPYLFGPADEGGALSILYCVGLLKEEGMENARAFLRRAAKKKPGIWLLVKEYPEFDFYEMLAEDVPRDDSASYM